MTNSGNPPVENESSLEPTTLELRAKALREVRALTALFNGSLSKDQGERSNALNKITQIVKTWAKECYPPEPEGSTAGTVGSGRENVSGVSSPIYNRNSSQRSSVSDGNNTFNSPLFTDESASVSASSYNVSPVVDSGFDTAPYDNVPAPFARFAKHGNGSVDYDDVNTRFDSNAKELKRDESLNGPGGDSSRRNSTDESIDDNPEKSKEGRKESLRLSILTMLRMSIDCPFADVRHSFHRCLNKLRVMKIPVPAPICAYPSFYIAPEEIITLAWPSEYAGNTISQNIPRSITPSGRSSCSSSSSSNSSSFSEEIPRIIQQPLTPSTPLYPTSPLSLSVGRQPDELVKKLIVDTFTGLGRLSHFYRILAYFPSFMEKYQKSYNVIVRNPNCGPLQIHWRFYIGMMAASQHKCQYTVSKLTDDFISCGGNISWLQGLEHAPAKLRKLATLNTILAHQPWRLSPSHIGALARGSENPQDNWTISEIVHAIVILSTFHSLSSYVLGCGIVPEYDSIGGNYDPPPSAEDSGNSYGISENISPDIAFGLGVSLNQDQPQEPESDKIKDKTMEPSKPIDIQKKSSSTPRQSDETDCTIKHTNQLIKRLKNKREIELSISHDDDKQINYGSMPSESGKTDFENVDEETFDDSSDDPSSPFPFSEDFFSSSHNDSHILTFNPPTTNEYYSRFLDKSVEIRHEEFIVNSPDYKVFKLGDYCWESEGVVMVNKFLSTGNDSPDVGGLFVGELLDREFAEIRELTDYSLFHSYQSPNMIDLDTRPLRQAVWNYVLRLFGIYKEDYEYSNIKTFLNGRIKEFLKKVSCRPEEIGYKDWRNVGFHLREEEKCHVNLIAVEARKQAELIHGLSCVMKYEKER